MRDGLVVLENVAKGLHTPWVATNLVPLEANLGQIAAQNDTTIRTLASVFKWLSDLASAELG